MSSYENVVGGKLKLKGKALDVKAGGVKKKKKHKKEREQIDQVIEHDLSAGWFSFTLSMYVIGVCSFSMFLSLVLPLLPYKLSVGEATVFYLAMCCNTFCVIWFCFHFAVGGSTEVSTTDPSETEINDGDKQIVEEKAAPYDDHLTPAERRYIDQRQKLDVNRLSKESNKSHRDRIQDFNQYLANMSEHYDIPKVGPG
ncbi:hypothetical protein EZV62_004502 [Acer yangbiense]|uniref:Uncharacterized protein n=1 Tax=Acer yangbiense TaxID=1000413 RepID=A0A5C7IJJ7_9ROSI|nr:hypothetical protein EZV62_004502 [Acer yangbiense]